MKTITDVSAYDWKNGFTRLLLLLLLLMPAYSLAENYRTYCNARFGFCVDYPEWFGITPSSFNNDGRTMSDGRGFEMTVTGHYNVLDATLLTDMREQSRDFDSITYENSKENWYVLSGYSGNNILYYKTFVGPGAINNLRIRYPREEADAYSDYVTRASRSFRPGELVNPD